MKKILSASLSLLLGLAPLAAQAQGPVESARAGSVGARVSAVSLAVPVMGPSVTAPLRDGIPSLPSLPGTAPFVPGQSSAMSRTRLTTTATLPQAEAQAAPLAETPEAPAVPPAQTVTAAPREQAAAPAAKASAQRSAAALKPARTTPSLLRRVVKHAQRIAAAFAILGVVCTASGCGGGGGGQTYYPDNSNYTQSGGPSGSYGLTGPYTTTAGSLYNVTVDLNNYSLAQDSFASGVLEDPYTYNIGFALTAPAAFFPSGWAAATYDSFSASEGGVIDQLSSEYEVDAEGSKIGFDWQSSYNHQFYVVYPYDSTSAGWYIASWGYAMPASQDYQDVEDTLNYYTTADQSLSAKVVQDDAGTYDVITPDQPTFALGSDVYWQTTSFNSYAEAVAFIYNSYDDSDTGRRLAMAAMNKLVYDVSGVYVLFYPTLGSSQAPAAGKQAPLAVVNNQGKVVLVLRAPKDGSTIWTAVRPRDPNKPHARPLFDQVSGTNAPAFQQALDGSLTARTEQLRIPANAKTQAPARTLTRTVNRPNLKALGVPSTDPLLMAPPQRRR